MCLGLGKPQGGKTFQAGWGGGLCWVSVGTQGCPSCGPVWGWERVALLHHSPASSWILPLRGSPHSKPALFIYLFSERPEGREKERETLMCERYIDWLSLAHPQQGTWPATQACALTGNRTRDPLVRRLELSPRSHSSQAEPCSLMRTSSGGAWATPKGKFVGTWAFLNRFRSECPGITHGNLCSLCHQCLLDQPPAGKGSGGEEPTHLVDWEA